MTSSAASKQLVPDLDPTVAGLTGRHPKATAGPSAGTVAMPGRGARILIVDGDDFLRASLETALVQKGYTVRAEADGTGAKPALEEFVPDLAILEAELASGPDGYALARLLRRLSALPIVFLSAAAGLADRLAGFEAGGDDYVAKPFVMAELLARVRALLARSGGRPPVVCEVEDLVIDHGRRTVTRAGDAIDLSPTEYQLLSLLAAHAHRVVTRDELMSQVWPAQRVNSNAMAVHISSLRRKLDATGPSLIHTVRGFGYRLGT